jgi:hypothetical protein
MVSILTYFASASHYPLWLDKTLDAVAPAARLTGQGVIYRDITSIYCLDWRSPYVTGCGLNGRDEEKGTGDELSGFGPRSGLTARGSPRNGAARDPERQTASSAHWSPNAGRTGSFERTSFGRPTRDPSS